MSARWNVFRIAALAVVALCGACGAGAPEAPATAPAEGPPDVAPTGTDLTWPPIAPGWKTEFRADALVLKDEVARQLVHTTQNAPVLGSCWPLAAGGILRRFAGASVPSPAEKFAALFLDAAGGTALTQWLQNNQGPGAPGVGAQSGLCQGWAAAAVLEPLVPQGGKTPVVLRREGSGGRSHLVRCSTRDAARPLSGCVAVLPGDALALAAEVYAVAPGRIVGARCTDSRIFYDGDGAAHANNCQSDAGLFFLALTNYVGRYRHGFILSLGTGPVWERPVYGYEVLQYDTPDVRGALMLLGETGQTTYDRNPLARAFRHVRVQITLGDVVDGQAGALPGGPGSLGLGLDLLLELDSQGKVIGGQWLGTSQGSHPLFYYIPTGPGTAAPGLDYRDVHDLITAMRE